MSGEKSALAEAVAAHEPEAEPAQADLLEGFEDAETGNVDAPSPLSALMPNRRTGPGRPKGSRNKNTEATRAWLLSQHRHPVAVLMEAYSMSPAELCAKIGVAATQDNLLAVFKMQMGFAVDAAPYVAQRLPQAVQLDAQSHFTIQLGGVDLGGVSAGARGGLAEKNAVIEGEALPVKLAQVGREKSETG